MPENVHQLSVTFSRFHLISGLICDNVRMHKYKGLTGYPVGLLSFAHCFGVGIFTLCRCAGGLWPMPQCGGGFCLWDYPPVGLGTGRKKKALAFVVWGCFPFVVRKSHVRL